MITNSCFILLKKTTKNIQSTEHNNKITLTNTKDLLVEGKVLTVLFILIYECISLYLPQHFAETVDKNKCVALHTINI